MKALVYHGPEDLRLEEIPEVVPEKNQVKIRVRACGICGSDVHGYAGLTGRRTAPMVMGHEFSGEVVSLGPEVKTLRIGDRVAPYPVEICGECIYCKSGRPHICLHKRAYGVLACNGAMAEYICVPETIAYRLGDSIDYAVGAMIEPMAVAYRGVGHGGDLTGKTVFIVGAGTIGLFVLALVKLRGAKKIMVSDLSAHRLEIAKKMGADIVFGAEVQDVPAAVREQTDGMGADVSLECVGITPTVSQAVSSLRLGGTAVWIGNSAKMIETNMQEIVTRELTVQGSFLYTLKEFEEVLRILESKKVDVRPIISQEITMEEAPEMFHTLHHTPGNLIKVVITSLPTPNASA